jgi:flagellar basal-body rod protein FlgC
MADLSDTLHISAAGMRVQGDRLRIVAENIANAESVANTPGGDPYRRKTITFKNALDRELNIQTVKVASRGFDKSEFEKKYEPNHPAADAQGYVSYPNVKTMIEMMDMREARRAYEANLNMVEISKSMLTQTIGLLK